MASWAETVAAAALNDGSSYSNAASKTLSDAGDTLERYIQGENKTVELSKGIFDELTAGTKDITTALGEEALTDVALANLNAQQQTLDNQEFVAQEKNDTDQEYKQSFTNFNQQMMDKGNRKLAEITQYTSSDNLNQQQQTKAPTDNALKKYLDNREWINPGDDLTDIGNRIIQRYNKDKSLQEAITPIKNEHVNAQIGLNEAVSGSSAQTTISYNAIRGRVINPNTGLAQDFTPDVKILRQLGIKDGDSVLKNIDPEKAAEYILNPGEAQKARDAGALLPIQYHAILFLANDKNALAYARDTIDYKNKLEDTLEGYIHDEEDAMRYVDLLLDNPKMADLYRFTSKRELANALLQKSLKNKSAITQERFNLASNENAIKTMNSPVSEGKKVDENNKQSERKGAEATTTQTPTHSPKVKPEVPNSGRSTSTSTTTNTNVQSSQGQVANQNNINAESSNDNADANSNGDFVDPTIPAPAQNASRQLTKQERDEINAGYDNVTGGIMSRIIAPYVSPDGQPSGNYELVSEIPLKDVSVDPINNGVYMADWVWGNREKQRNQLAATAINDGFMLIHDDQFNNKTHSLFKNDPTIKHMMSVAKALNKTSISETPDKLIESLAIDRNMREIENTISNIDKQLSYIDNKYKDKEMPENAKQVREKWSNFRDVVSAIKDYKELKDSQFNATSKLGRVQVDQEILAVNKAMQNIDWANKVQDEANKTGRTVTGKDGEAAVILKDRDGNDIEVPLKDVKNAENNAKGQLITAYNRALDAINGGVSPAIKVNDGKVDYATNMYRNMNYSLYNLLTGETLKNPIKQSETQELAKNNVLEDSIPLHIAFNVISRYIEPTQENVDRLLTLLSELNIKDKFATKNGTDAHTQIGDIISAIQNGIADKGLKIRGGTLLLSADTNEITLIKKDITNLLFLVTEETKDGNRKYYNNKGDFMKKVIYKNNIDEYNKDNYLVRALNFGYAINNEFDAYKSQYSK